MTWMILLAVCLVVFCAILFGARKAGKDSVKAKTAEKILEQIVDATRPVSPTQRERLRSRYRRP